MKTELTRETGEREKLQHGIEICEQAITKAEKYERLIDNLDFKGYLKDLEILAGIHDNEIVMGVSMLSDAPSHPYVKEDGAGNQIVVSSKSDWADFIARHNIQKTELKNWIKEPERIVAMARLAREKLPLLKEKMSEIPDHGPVSENGKS